MGLVIWARVRREVRVCPPAHMTYTCTASTVSVIGRPPRWPVLAHVRRLPASVVVGAVHILSDPARPTFVVVASFLTRGFVLQRPQAAAQLSKVDVLLVPTALAHYTVQVRGSDSQPLEGNTLLYTNSVVAVWCWCA